MSKMSIQPSAFHGELSDLERMVIDRDNKPPKLSAADMHLLDFHTMGIAAVREALKMKPFAYLDYRELSRYASKLALDRMDSCPVIVDLKEARKDYHSRKAHLEQRVRQFYDDMLEGTTYGYKPFVPARNLHIWLWDNTVSEAVHASIGSSGIAQRSFFVFVADVLSELDSLGTVADDLKAEYLQGLRYFKHLLSDVILAVN